MIQHDLMKQNLKPNFPKWIGKTIKQVCPQLDAAGCDLLMVSYC